MGGRLLLAAVLAAAAVGLTVAAGALARRWAGSRVVVELAVGVGLGVGLGAWAADVDARLVRTAQGLLDPVGTVVVVAYLLGVGLQHPPEPRGRSRGALLAVALPAAAALALVAGLVSAGEQVSLPGALFLVAALSVTALPVLARLLEDLDVPGWPVPPLALRLAAGCDAWAWGLVLVATALASGSGPAAAGPLVVLLAWAAGVRALGRALRRRSGGTPAAGSGSRPGERPGVGPRSRPGPAALAGLALAGGSGLVVAGAGVHPAFLAYWVGLCLAGAGLPDALARALRGARVLLPAYFVASGLSVELVAGAGAGLLVAVLAAAVVGKALSGLAVARAHGLSRRDAAALAVALNVRGLTELVVLDAGRRAGLLEPRLHAALVVMAVVTTAVAPLLLRRAVRGDRVQPGDRISARR